MKPVAKARARVTKYGAYTPAKSARAEACIKQHLNKLLVQKYEGALSLEVTAVIEKPKSLPKRRVFNTTRPDASNYLKLVEDACNGILYEDDAQLVSVQCSKVYGSPEGFHVKLGHIFILEDLPCQKDLISPFPE